MRIDEALERIRHGGALSFFYRSLALGLGGGLPLSQGLELLRGPESRQPVRARADVLLGAVRSGRDLAAAIAAVQPLFLALELTLLRLGETQGRLQESCQALAWYFDCDDRVARKIMLSLLPPFFTLGVGGVVLPLPIAFIAGVGPYLALVAGSWLLTFFLAGTSFLRIFDLERGRPRWAMARLCHALATALEMGIPPPYAAELAADAVAPAELAVALRGVSTSVRPDEPMSRVLRMTGHAPSHLLAALENAERTGETAGTLRHLAMLYEQGTIGDRA